MAIDTMSICVQFYLRKYDFRLICFLFCNSLMSISLQWMKIDKLIDESNS